MTEFRNKETRIEFRNKLQLFNLKNLEVNINV